MIVSAIAASAWPERISPMRVSSDVIGIVAVALPFPMSVKERSKARTQGAKFSSRKAWASCGVISGSPSKVRDITHPTFRAVWFAMMCGIATKLPGTRQTSRTASLVRQL